MDLIDEWTIRTSSVIFLIIAILSMVADGYDISTMDFTVPELLKQWRVSPHAPVLSAGVLGLLFGAPPLAYVGDRFGRRKRSYSSVLARQARTDPATAIPPAGRLRTPAVIASLGQTTF